jgi:hypothetical protein
MGDSMCWAIVLKKDLSGILQNPPRPGKGKKGKKGFKGKKGMPPLDGEFFKGKKGKKFKKGGYNAPMAPPEQMHTAEL